MAGDSAIALIGLIALYMLSRKKAPLGGPGQLFIEGTYPEEKPGVQVFKPKIQTRVRYRTPGLTYAPTFVPKSYEEWKPKWKAARLATTLIGVSPRNVLNIEGASDNPQLAEEASGNGHPRYEGGVSPRNR